jgi:hypothetical protein
VIILEFKRDGLVIEKIKEINIESVDPTTLSRELLVMPVHLRIDDVELLEISTQFGRAVTDWPFLPIVDVATYGLEKVYDAWQKGLSEIWVSETGLRLGLEREDDKITLRSYNMGHVCTVSYDELRRVFEDFARDVREMLVEEAPDLTKHPYWGGWFRGEVKTPWRDWQDE